MRSEECRTAEGSRGVGLLLDAGTSGIWGMGSGKEVKGGDERTDDRGESSTASTSPSVQRAYIHNIHTTSCARSERTLARQAGAHSVRSSFLAFAWLFLSRFPLPLQTLSSTGRQTEPRLNCGELSGSICGHRTCGSLLAAGRSGATRPVVRRMYGDGPMVHGERRATGGGSVGVGDAFVVPRVREPLPSAADHRPSELSTSSRVRFLPLPCGHERHPLQGAKGTEACRPVGVMVV